MFIAGLETSIDEFEKNGKASTAVGVLGIIVPFAIGYAVGWLMKMSEIESMFIGLILSATSVSISVQALKELGKLRSREGAVILGAAIIDDILVMIGLAIMSGLIGEQVSIGFVIVKMLAFFLLSVLVGWILVPWVLKRFALLKVTETVISAGLIILFVFAILADMTGIAAIIGAYIAGIFISLTSYKKEVAVKVETIGYSIFIPVFFTSIGIKADFSGLSDYLWPILLISLVAIFSKLAGAFIGAKINSFSSKSSFAIGTAMVSRGEVALIISAIGLNSGIINEAIFTLMVAVIMVTTLISPPLMKIAFTNERYDKERNLKSIS